MSGNLDEAPDTALLDQHFRSEYTGMLSYASRHLGDPALAEVAVQNVFVTALYRLDAYTGSPKPVGWLYNTLKYKISEILREKHQRCQSLRPLEDTDAAAPWPEESILFPADDPDYRLLCRFYLEGYSIEELARADGITIGACKMRLKRARERLRRKYASER